MPTLTLKVPRELSQKLEAASARRRVSKSEIMRDALVSALAREKTAPNLHDRMKDSIGCVRSGKKDLATNPKYLRKFGQWRS